LLNVKSRTAAEYNLTRILLKTGLASFDAIVHNSARKFIRS